MRVSPLTFWPPTRVALSLTFAAVDGIDPSAYRQHFRGELHGLRKVAGQMGHGHEEQISEAVSLEPPAAGETIVEQLRKERLILAQSHHAVADVARRQDVEIAPQPPGAAAVVGYRDHGGDLQRALGGLDVALQSP